MSEPRQTEQTLLRHIRSRAAHSSLGSLRLGIGDDCALLRPRRGEELAVTTDLSIAGRHFRLDWHSTRIRRPSGSGARLERPGRHGRPSRRSLSFPGLAART